MNTDLTKINQPIGKLDAKTRAALKAHGGPYEKLTGGTWWPADNPGWMNPDTIYRVKPPREDGAEKLLRMIRAI